MASDQPITERRWFTLMWGRGEPLSDGKYVFLLVTLLLATVLVVFLIVVDATWWLALSYLILVTNFGGQVYRERERRMRERATRLRNSRTAPATASGNRKSTRT